MKKVLLALLAAVLVISACTPKEVLPSSVSLDKTKLALVEGDSYTLKALVNPSDAANKELTWSSSADAVATVDETGKVIAIKEGTATITATCKAATSVKATCEVTVTKKAVPVETVQLSETDPVSLTPDETLQLSAVISPANATDNNVTWASDNTSVATVDANGLVTALQGGVAYITATVGGKTSDALMVTVLEPRPLFLRYPYCLLRTGDSFTQTIWYGTNFKDKDKDNKPVMTWTSDNTAVATPEDGNVFRAVGPGTATISGKDAAGGRISFTIVVEDRPEIEYDDYMPGIELVNCHDNSGGWIANGEYALTDGYVEGTQCMGATITGYKIAEVLFHKRVDVSSVKNPALFIRIYIDDISKFQTKVMGNEPFVELSSEDDLNTFSYAEHRLFWRMRDMFTNMSETEETAKQTLHSGWNNIVLPFDRAAQNKFTEDYNEKSLTQMRFIQMYSNPPLFIPTYEPMEVKIDQLRVIDWTQLEACDNFTMWRDRPAQDGQYCYLNDTEGKIQGSSCVACKQVLLDSPVTFRLEMWPGLEYSIPAWYDVEDLAFECKIWLEDAEWWNTWINFDFEISSSAPGPNGRVFTPDNNGFDVSFGPDGAEWPVPLKDGWNTIRFNFEDKMEWLKGEYWDPHKIDYFRLVLSPIQMPNAQVDYRTYKIDDIRIVRK